MPDGVFGAAGHLFRVDGGVLDERVARILATLRVDAGDPVGAYAIAESDEGFEVRWNDESVGNRSTADSVLLLLHWHINQRTIDASVARRTTFHAAAARSPNGNGILLAAPMESGKTTTVTGLLRAGWDYLTDEAVGADDDGTLWGYPKPLTIDRGSWPLFPELEPGDLEQGAQSWLVPVTALARAVVPTAPLRLIVFPSYRSGGPTELGPISTSEAALELAHSTFQFDEHGRRDLRTVSLLARTTAARRLAVGNLAEAVSLLQALDEGLGAAA